MRQVQPKLPLNLTLAVGRLGLAVLPSATVSMARRVLVNGAAEHVTSEKGGHHGRRP